MRVIPTHDSIVGVLFVFDLVNMFPSVLGKSSVGAGFISIRACDASLNFDPVWTVLSDQNSTDFGL
jgi:hypothetical protein